MPRKLGKVPAYGLHKASGQAVVRISARDHYLGVYGTDASHEKYERLIAQWRAMRLVATEPAAGTVKGHMLTVNAVLLSYLEFAAAYYARDGKTTQEYQEMTYALKPVRQLYGRTPARDFGPLALKTVREQMMDDGLARSLINARVNRIKRTWKWAVSEELLPPGAYEALRTVAGLRKGHTTARETAPVRPVADQVVDATLPHLPPVVADMVRFQRLTGCRPGEVCILRPRDVDTSGDVWEYRPATHKTEHYGHQRVIFIGPQAQRILRPYLLRAGDSYCFSPADSERKRRGARHEERTTPLSCGNRPGTNRRTSPRRVPGERYTTGSYGYAIARACNMAFPPPAPLTRRDTETIAAWDARLTDEQRAQLKLWRATHRWSPNQLRHSAGTSIRKRYGIEAAQVVLGHATTNATQIYAERNLDAASRIAGEIG